MLWTYVKTEIFFSLDMLLIFLTYEQIEYFNVKLNE